MLESQTLGLFRIQSSLILLHLPLWCVIQNYLKLCSSAMRSIRTHPYPWIFSELIGLKSFIFRMSLTIYVEVVSSSFIRLPNFAAADYGRLYSIWQFKGNS